MIDSKFTFTCDACGVQEVRNSKDLPDKWLYLKLIYDKYEHRTELIEVCNDCYPPGFWREENVEKKQSLLTKMIGMLK